MAPKKIAQSIVPISNFDEAMLMFLEPQFIPRKHPNFRNLKHGAYLLGRVFDQVGWVQVFAIRNF